MNIVPLKHQTSIITYTVDIPCVTADRWENSNLSWLMVKYQRNQALTLQSVKLTLRLHKENTLPLAKYFSVLDLCNIQFHTQLSMQSKKCRENIYFSNSRNVWACIFAANVWNLQYCLKNLWINFHNTVSYLNFALCHSIFYIDLQVYLHRPLGLIWSQHKRGTQNSFIGIWRQTWKTCDSSTWQFAFFFYY